MKLPSLILPPLPESPTLDPQLRSWAEYITRYLEDFNQKAKQIPFNQSEELTISDTGTANTQFSITHHLERIPLGYVTLKISNGGIIYDGTSSWTTTTIYLRCTTANANVKILVF